MLFGLEKRRRWILGLSLLILLALPCSLGAKQRLSTPKKSSVKKSKKRKRKLRAWPRPKQLVESIQPLLEIEPTRVWAKQTLTLIDLLIQCETVGAPENQPIFSQLKNQIAKLDELTVRVSERPVQHPANAIGPLAGELRRLRYQLVRRLVIWIPLYEIASAEKSIPAKELLKSVPMAQQANGVKIRFDGVEPVWHDYLLVKETEAAFNRLDSSVQDKQDAARKLLARIYSPSLSKAQSEFVQKTVDENSISFFKKHAAKPVDYSVVLRNLERHEAYESGLSQKYLNDSYQSMLWSDQVPLRQLAAAIDTHYRNANFRVTISEKLINRLMPEMPETTEPISEHLLGAQVYGQTNIRNRLRIGLIPDSDRIHLQLESTGSADTSTTALKSGFAVQNQGFSRFQVFQKLAISRNGIFSDRARAFSQSNNRMVGIRSNFDQIPVIGNLARRVARKQVQAQKQTADNLTKQKFEKGVEDYMQTEVEKQIRHMRNLVSQNLIQPLVSLELEPEPVQMTTTKEKLIVRYRLAGRDQMAANTTRPKAWPGSQLSLQVHHSAVNNFLDRIGLAGKDFTTDSLTTHLRDAMGLPYKEVDSKKKAKITFSKTQPIRVSFVDGKFQIDLNIDSFEPIGSKRTKTWRKLVIRCCYAPSVSGSQVLLTREGSISLPGRRKAVMDELVIRAIFDKVFENQYHFQPLPDSLAKPMNSPDLVIAHLIIDNGWLGVSLIDAPVIAQPGDAAIRR